jgi:Uma2 family endonuclease
MALREKIISADEFWEYSQAAEDEMRRDLIEGVIYEISQAGETHGIIAGNIFGFIWNFVRQHSLGRVTAAETGYILHKNPDGKDTVLAPDVGFVGNERLPAQPSPRYVPVAPDLAVEVVLPNDQYPEVAHKRRLYRAHGTRLVWIVDPKYRTVEVHTSDGMRTLQGDDTLDGGDVLPGFTLPLRDVFPRDGE